MPIKIDMKGHVVAKLHLTHLLKHAKHRIDDLCLDIVYGQTYKFAYKLCLSVINVPTSSEFASKNSKALERPSISI